MSFSLLVKPRYNVKNQNKQKWKYWQFSISWNWNCTMTTIRQFTCDDLFRFNPINLDPLTETYGVGFYLQYLARWPEYFLVAESPAGDLCGYIMGKGLTFFSLFFWGDFDCVSIQVKQKVKENLGMVMWRLCQFLLIIVGWVWRRN